MKTWKQFKEEVADVIQNSMLLEMAFERKVLVSKVRSLQYQIAVHMLKVIAYRNNPAKNHWKSELNAWLWQI